MGETADFVVLEPAESLTLLRTVEVGRLVYTEDALPAVHPVNFLVHEDTVVICTAAGAKLSAATDGVVVAFQADQINPATRQGWSVTVVGHSRVVAEPAERAALTALPLQPWVPGERCEYIRVQVEHVKGRRLAQVEPIPDPTVS